MGRKKELASCRTTRDFVRWAERHGAEVTNGGSHPYKVRVPGHRSCPLPDHPGEMPRGLRYAIIKSFKAMGLLTIVGLVLFGLLSLV